MFFFFKQKTAYEMRISDWSSDVCSSDLAIVSLGVANSRMKDFYDLWMIAQTFTFEGVVLTNAVQQTFERRRTSWPEQTPSGLSDAFANEKDAQWRAFLARDRLGAAPASLVQVPEDLRAFLQPMLAREELASWSPGGPWTPPETGRQACRERR